MSIVEWSTTRAIDGLVFRVLFILFILFVILDLLPAMQPSMDTLGLCHGSFIRWLAPVSLPLAIVGLPKCDDTFCSPLSAGCRYPACLISLPMPIPSRILPACLLPGMHLQLPDSAPALAASMNHDVILGVMETGRALLRLPAAPWSRVGRAADVQGRGLLAKKLLPSMMTPIVSPPQP